jgi:sRNA-binding carbon storage regulator CsrA
MTIMLIISRRPGQSVQFGETLQHCLTVNNVGLRGIAATLTVAGQPPAEIAIPPGGSISIPGGDLHLKSVQKETDLARLGFDLPLSSRILRDDAKKRAVV